MMSINLIGQHSEECSQSFITYGDQKIYYTRLPRDESIRRIKIKVHPDCRVEVLAPLSATASEVEEGVKAKARWIVKKLRVFQEQMTGVTPRQYVSGESHYYLGKQYQLKVFIAENEPVGVSLYRGVLKVTVRRKDSVGVKNQLEKWYRVKAKELFNARLDVLIAQTLWLSEKPKLRILAMRSQWGSCSPSGTITLNPKLVKASKDCIDYVILHELCHLAEHNHSENFYRLMKQVMPNWESVKLRLDSKANAFLM